MQTENKNHWYDGLFYDKVIAPHQDKAFDQIKNLIEANTILIDAGCGTGRLEFYLADKCRKVVGVDLSERNISIAKKNLAKSNFNNIEFYHADINKFQKETDIRFDYAVISYVIHEIEENKRKETLTLLSQIAEKIIIIDHLPRQRFGLGSVLNEAVEFVAGRDHYRNFKSFIKNDGIEGLAKLTGLKVINEIRSSNAVHIAVLIK